VCFISKILLNRRRNALRLYNIVTAHSQLITANWIRAFPRW